MQKIRIKIVGLCLLALTSFSAISQTFTDFRFTAEAIGWQNDLVGVINNQNLTITFTTQKWIENIAQLPATFNLSGDYEVKIEQMVQKSGITTNDFRRDVVYTINGNVRYTVIFVSPQASGLPMIKINTENGVDITSKEIYTNMTFVLSDPNNPANNISKTDMNDLIRGRGNSTWYGHMVYPDRKPYRIKFDKKTSLFGLPAAKSWVLLANFYDPTLIKNTFAFELGNRLDMPYSHSYHYVDLYLNEAYNGNYILTEHNQVGEGRVEIDENEGWFVELDFHYDEEPKFTTHSYNIPVMIKSPEFEPAVMTNPAYAFVKNDWDQLCNMMISSTFPENGYRELIDMESIVKLFTIALITGTGDFDNPGSVYFYKDKNGKISGGPSWDFDINFGFNWDNVPVYQINVANAYCTPTSAHYLQYWFFKRFFEDPLFFIKMKEIWNNNYSKIASMSQFIDDMAHKIRKSATENFKISWVDYPVDFDYWVEEMKKFLNARINYLDLYYREATDINTPPTNSLKISVRDGLLHISGLCAGETLNIYNATGMLIHHSNVTGNEMKINLPAQGVYIVRSGKDIEKVVF